MLSQRPAKSGGDQPFTSIEQLNRLSRESIELHSLGPGKGAVRWTLEVGSVQEEPRLENKHFVKLLLRGLLDGKTSVVIWVLLELPTLPLKKGLSIWPQIDFLLNQWIRKQLLLSFAWQCKKQFRSTPQSSLPVEEEQEEEPPESTQFLLTSEVDRHLAMLAERHQLV